MNAPFMAAPQVGTVAARTSGRCPLVAGGRTAGWFATPWHVCVHGLGLDTATAEVPIAQLVRLAELLVERSGCEPVACVIRESLHLLTCVEDAATARSAQRIADLLAWTGAPQVRAIALAAVLHALVHRGATGLAGGLLSSFLGSTLTELLTAAAVRPREHYRDLCAAVQLLNAAQRVPSVRSLSDELACHFDRALLQSLRLAQPFQAKRLRAVLLAVQARGPGAAGASEWLDHLAQLLTRSAAVHGPLPADDAIHSGLDFITFPLALALEAAAQSPSGRGLAVHSGAAQTALDLLEQLSPASQVSQLAFLVAPLLALEAVPLAVLQQRAGRVLQHYLDNSADNDADAYLRSAYALCTASHLGCVAELPRAVLARIEQSLLVRERPVTGYFSLPMVAAYALYSSGVAPAACRALPDPQSIAAVLAANLPHERVPAAEVHKLGHALLYRALAQPARGEHAHANAECERSMNQPAEVAP